MKEMMSVLKDKFMEMKTPLKVFVLFVGIVIVYGSIRSCMGV